MDVPLWALTLVYWLHMLATVVWIGGLAALSILILPAARKARDARLWSGEQGYATFLDEIQRRLDSLGWFSLAVLVGTGMVQMSANPNYQGFLAIDNRWAVALFIKHIVFLGMAGLAAYLSWGVRPRLRSLALRQALAQKSHDLSSSALAEQIENLQRQEIIVLRFSLVLGLVVLVLTALARAS
jgi:uncharacterized membrane protein